MLEQARRIVMPSFDIVSRVEMQEVDNAVNNTKRALAQRFDFRGARADLELDRKEKKLKFLTEDNMKMEAMRETFVQNAVRRGLDPKTFKFEDSEPGAAGNVKREVKIQEGLSQDIARAIVKRIKGSGLKVQASILGDEVRVTGKKIDDLQSVMSMLKEAEDMEIPLQFVNMKS
jgi:cyclic-di-GMP-binding protein